LHRDRRPRGIEISSLEGETAQAWALVIRLGILTDRRIGVGRIDERADLSAVVAEDDRQVRDVAPQPRPVPPRRDHVRPDDDRRGNAVRSLASPIGGNDAMAALAQQPQEALRCWPATVEGDDR